MAYNPMAKRFSFLPHIHDIHKTFTNTVQYYSIQKTILQTHDTGDTLQEA